MGLALFFGTSHLHRKARFNTRYRRGHGRGVGLKMPPKSTMRFLYAAELNSRKYSQVEKVSGFWPNSREQSDKVELRARYFAAGRAAMLGRTTSGREQWRDDR